MSVILAAHGTRLASGVAMIADLAAQVSEIVDRPVKVAYVDVLGPTPSEVLGDAMNEPATVLPAFLTRGYHVHSDIPAHVAASRHPDVTVTPALGPSRDLVALVAQQLAKSGWRTGDSVILAAAGTSDFRAQEDLRTTAAMLSALTNSHVSLGLAATGEPHVNEAVSAARRHGARRVAVASYLLADGLFQGRLRDSGADLLSEPLGTHPGLARLIANRFYRALYQAQTIHTGRISRSA